MALFDRFRRKKPEAGTAPAAEAARAQPETMEAEGTMPMSDQNSATATNRQEEDAQRDAPASAASAERPTPGAGIDVAKVRDDVIAVLKTVYDPEIPVDIYELGLIYEVEVEPTGDVSVVMTLTTPMCPVAETLPPEVEAKVRDVPGVRHCQLELVWEPPWSMDMMSEAARLELNL